MISRFVFTVLISFLTILSTVGLALENPVVGTGTGLSLQNPIVGTGTIPQSSFQDGLVNSPKPISTSGNLIVTGNVSGGKHFRDSVPYGSTWDFRAETGTSSLDSFLRYSAGKADSQGYTWRYEPYRSQSTTVTRTLPGAPGVIRPPTAKVGKDDVDDFTLYSLPERRVRSSQDQDTSDVSLKPMLMTSEQMEHLVSREYLQYPQGGKEITGQREEQVEQFQSNLRQVNDGLAALERKLLEEGRSLQEPTKEAEQAESKWQIYKKSAMNERQPSPAFLEREGTRRVQRPEKQPSGEEQFDVYEGMEGQIDNLQEEYKGTSTGRVSKWRLEQKPMVARYDRKYLGTGGEEGKKGERPSSNGTEGILLEALRERTSQKKQGAFGDRGTLGQKGFEGDKSSRVALAIARAKGIFGEHETLASYSGDKFSKHMTIAEEYLRKGKYYWAANSYAMALAYNPDDPLAYAGRSYALFGAGEYISSALFLSRALEIYPEYAGERIDIEAIIGDRDVLDSRIADVEQWLAKSKTPELEFLLGYIYYQMGRLERAKGNIDRAYEKIPESPAVIALKEAIDSAISE